MTAIAIAESPEEMANAIELVQTLAKPVSNIGSIGELDLEIFGESDELVITFSDAEKKSYCAADSDTFFGNHSFTC